MDTVQIPRIDIFNNFCYSLMVGSLMIDFLKLTVLSVKPIPRTSKIILIALVLMIISLVISATRKSMSPLVSFIMGMVGIYLQQFAILLIVYLSYLRTSTLYNVQPNLKYLSNVLIVVLVTMAWSVRIINNINDVNQFTNHEAPIPFITQQIMKCILNLVASVFVLYFETYTTLQIFKTIGSSSRHPAHISNQKRIETYAKLLSFLIFMMFLLSFLFQLLLMFDINVGFTPLYSIGWSLVLKRMIEFKTDFNSIMSTRTSSGPARSNSRASNPIRESQIQSLLSIDNKY